MRMYLILKQKKIELLIILLNLHNNYDNRV